MNGNKLVAVTMAAFFIALLGVGNTAIAGPLEDYKAGGGSNKRTISFLQSPDCDLLEMTIAGCAGQGAARTACEKAAKAVCTKKKKNPWCYKHVKRHNDGPDKGKKHPCDSGTHEDRKTGKCEPDIVVPPPLTDVCGDGKITGAEACDDSNTADDDGCSKTCQVEENWTCEGEPSVCTEKEVEANWLNFTLWDGINFGLLLALLGILLQLWSMKRKKSKRECPKCKLVTNGDEAKCKRCGTELPPPPEMVAMEKAVAAAMDDLGEFVSEARFEEEKEFLTHHIEKRSNRRLMMAFSQIVDDDLEKLKEDEAKATNAEDKKALQARIVSSERYVAFMAKVSKKVSPKTETTPPAPPTEASAEPSSPDETPASEPDDSPSDG